MKSYKKATLVAKNARNGSYAAGCPVHTPPAGDTPNACRSCEVAN
jgi:hypothetical protein